MKEKENKNMENVFRVKELKKFVKSEAQLVPN